MLHFPCFFFLQGSFCIKTQRSLEHRLLLKPKCIHAFVTVTCFCIDILHYLTKWGFGKCICPWTMVSETFLCLIFPSTRSNFYISLTSSHHFSMTKLVIWMLLVVLLRMTVYSEKCFMQAKINAFTTFLLMPFVSVQVVCAACEGWGVWNSAQGPRQARTWDPSFHSRRHSRRSEVRRATGQEKATAGKYDVSSCINRINIWQLNAIGTIHYLYKLASFVC